MRSAVNATRKSSFESCACAARKSRSAALGLPLFSSHAARLSRVPTAGAILRLSRKRAQAVARSPLAIASFPWVKSASALAASPGGAA